MRPRSVGIAGIARRQRQPTRLLRFPGRSGGGATLACSAGGGAQFTTATGGDADGSADSAAAGSADSADDRGTPPDGAKQNGNSVSQCAAACGQGEAEQCDVLHAASQCSAAAPCSSDHIDSWNLAAPFGTCGGIQG